MTNLQLFIYMQRVTLSDHDICDIHCVPKKVYHPTANDNFNSCCPISIIFVTNITE